MTDPGNSTVAPFHVSDHAEITNAIAGKLAKASNLSDLSDAAVARSNLGLGLMATQNAGAVSITGGSIEGVTLDGGIF